LTPDSDDYIQLYSSFPAHEGSLLDLRDIEQGLDLGNSRIQGQHTELMQPVEICLHRMRN
ncbi:potra, shlb-type family domain protein, partial [Escherichia coli B105]